MSNNQKQWRKQYGEGRKDKGDGGGSIVLKICMWIVKELSATKLCAKELCLCVTKLCVTKLCAKELCVTKLCVKEMFVCVWRNCVCVCVRVRVRVWNIWRDVKLLPWLTELLFLIRFFAITMNQFWVFYQAFIQSPFQLQGVWRLIS